MLGRLLLLPQLETEIWWRNLHAPGASTLQGKCGKQPHQCSGLTVRQLQCRVPAVYVNGQREPSIWMLQLTCLGEELQVLQEAELEPGITSPIPSDTQQDKGECPGLRARLSLPQVTDCYVGNKHENLVTARKRLFSLSKESRHR